MNAALILPHVAAALNRHSIDAALIGDSAAALQGGPVTTLAIQFEFRMTAESGERLLCVAADLGATLVQPYASNRFFRIALPTGVQIDLVPAVGPSRARTLTLDGVIVRVRRRKLSARLRQACVRDMVRHWQALPPGKRTHFLRGRIGLRATCL